MYAELAAEFKRRANKDQAVRTGESDWEVMDRIDTDNTAWLKAVVSAHGWPGKELVGADGARDAWLLAQHSPDRAFQKEALDLLHRAARGGDAEWQHVALLEDRVRVGEGRPQLYGSQYARRKDGAAELLPVEDPARMDERRAAVGLEPHADYDRRMRERPT